MLQLILHLTKDLGYQELNLLCVVHLSLNNITGGLQDHCGFKLNDKFLTADDYVELGSLHDDTKWKNNPELTWGEWVKPVWPSNRSIQGSPETPLYL